VNFKINVILDKKVDFREIVKNKVPILPQKNQEETKVNFCFLCAFCGKRKKYMVLLNLIDS
jgi:hypothetical protein